MRWAGLAVLLFGCTFLWAVLAPAMLTVPRVGSDYIFYDLPGWVKWSSALVTTVGFSLGSYCAYRFIKGMTPPRLHCTVCGYELRGQTEPRCPECGTPFHTEEDL
jgi:hypothetical protein